MGSPMAIRFFGGSDGKGNMDIPGGKGKIRCVIYDCDGVLFDSLAVNRRFYNHICASTGRAPLTEPELRYVHTHTVHEAIQFPFRK